MRSIEAPVVPITLASAVPLASRPVFSSGVPCRLPLIWMPPVAANSAVSRITNGMYSAISVCSTTPAACPGPYSAAKGSRNAAAQAAETLPKW